MASLNSTTIMGLYLSLPRFLQVTDSAYGPMYGVLDVVLCMGGHVSFYMGCTSCVVLGVLTVV